MGTSQQFSLRWNNYLRHIREAFDSLRTDEDLVDVTLSCEGKKIRAHKMLLSACSTYFRDLFKENPCQHPVIIFKDVKFADLKALIDFIYQGEVNVVQDQLSSFLLTAELLAVQGLTDGSSKDVPEISSETNTAKLLDLSAHDEESRTPERSGSPSDSLHSPPVKKQRCNDANASPTSTSVSDTHSASACASEKLSEQCAPSLSNSCPEICKQTRTEAIRPADMIKVEMPDYLDHDSVELCASSENGEERVENPANSSSDRKGPPYLPHLNSHDISHHSINPLLDISRVMGLCGPSSALCSRELTQDFVCPECGAVFKNLQGLNVHKSRHNGGTACELCFRDFGNINSIASLRLSDRYPCKYCEKTFNTLPILERHVAARHQLQEEMFFCAVCARYFKTKWSLSTHNSRYHKTK